MPAETLYGIEKSNRSADNLWGKNQFNSSFPASLACYMRDQGINAVYVYLDQDLNVRTREIPVSEVFNVSPDARTGDIEFHFESKYEPYQAFARDDIRGIDLVIRQGDSFRRALEVKLTVVPDQTTFRQEESQWAPEVVIRPASTSYCGLGMIESCKDDLATVRDIFEPLCSGIQTWNNHVEILSRQEAMVDTLNHFQTHFIEAQKPFLMQPIWKTRGKSPILDSNAFDIFVWSDFALCRTFIDRSSDPKAKTVSRFLRSSARLSRFLYEVSCQGKTNISRIYTDMSFNSQSDKEFALSGKITRNYLDHPRRTKPALGPEVLKEIILNGGERKLSPERRFDQTVFYTASELFEK